MVMVMVIYALVSSQARADLIAIWQFNSGPNQNGTDADNITDETADNTTNPTGPAITGLNNFKPDYGSQSSTSTANTTIGGGGASQRTTGTTVNEFMSSSSNNGYSLQHNSTFSLTLKISGAGLSGFVLTYATEQNSGTTLSQAWSYSTDGTTYTPFSTVSVPSGTLGSSWAAYTVDFSSVSPLNGAANVFFQDTFSTKTAPGNSSVDFDNIAINTVPEPISYAMAAFGVMFVGGSAGRFYLRRKNISPAA